MKIGFLGDPLDRQYAGVHVYTRELLYHLDNLLPESDQLFLVRPERGDEFDHFKEIQVPISGIPGHQSLRMFYQIPRLMRRHKVDVVMEPAHFGPFNLPGSIKRVTVIHDLTPILFPEHHVFHGRLLQQIFLKGILRRADLIITNSAYTRSDVERVYPFTKGKVKDILLGRDPFYQPTEDTSFREKFQIHGPYILYVGTIEPRKDLPTLIEAFSRFKKATDSSCKLVIAGKLGWKYKSFSEALEASEFTKDILVTGYVEKTDLRALYSHCEVFVYPSMYEGFGFPVLEAMSCGAPCIVADNSSLPEVGGNAATYYTTHDVSELTTCISNILLHPEKRQALRELSIQRARQFDWEKTARQTLEALHNLVESQ